MIHRLCCIVNADCSNLCVAKDSVCEQEGMDIVKGEKAAWQREPRRVRAPEGCAEGRRRVALTAARYCHIIARLQHATQQSSVC